MKTIIVSLIIVLTIFTFVAPSHALWWMVYHKPAFKGKVIDAETKEPIEGAVVVAVYDKATIGLGAGSISSIIEVRETLTDKEGMFHIPSYLTIIQPFSIENEANFIIFKPGYGSFPWHRVSPPMEMSLDVIEEYFIKEVGKTDEIVQRSQVPATKGKILKRWNVIFGIVELPKLKTREERRDSLPSIPGPGIPSIKMKNLIRLSNEERISLGLKPEEWP
ncbi:MAG: hypothetical protein AABY39_02600 [Nitrospirota bacterium]